MDNHLNVFVVDHNGVPIADATATLFVDDQEVGSITTRGFADAPGGFDIPDTIGHVKIRVQHGNFTETQLVDTKSRNVTFELKPKKHPPQKPLILFIHGLGGDGTSTFGKFQELFARDSSFGEKFKTAFYIFPTSLLRIPFVTYVPYFYDKPVKIQVLSAGLDTELKYRYQENDDVTLVCHSFGGLIAKKYLIDKIKKKEETRVNKVALYATPNNGSDLAGVARMISWKHKQLSQLCKDADMIELSMKIGRCWG